MKTLNIDINAHVTNIACYVDGGNSTISISFDNISNKEIVAIKFTATGYNSFGDIVAVNGRNNFFVIIQDIKVDGNDHIAGLKAKLPHVEIRKIELEESQICYSDGTVLTYLGKDVREFAVADFCDDMDNETIHAIGNRFGKQLCVHADEFDCGWICSCQRFNDPTAQKGSCCGNNKTDILSLNNPETVAELLSEYRLKEQERKEMEKVIAIQKEKEDKKRTIKKLIGIVIGIALVFIIGYLMIMAGRTIYASEDAMKAAVQGTYTYYNDSGKATRQIVISGDKAIYKWKSGSELESDIREWNYKSGTIRTFENLIVTSEGNLKDGGDIYKKGGSMSSGSSSESGYSALKITVNSVSSNSVYTVCTGSVKNTGNKTYKYIKVKGSFKDSEGNVIDTDWTYAAGSEGLSPNESTTFSLSVTKNSNIKSCSVKIFGFD